MDDAMTDVPTAPAHCDPAAHPPPAKSRAKPRAKPKPSRKRGAAENATGDAARDRKVIRVKKESLSVFQALNIPVNSVFPVSLLVVAPTGADAREVALAHSPIKGSESLDNRMVIHPIYLTQPTVSFPGMGGPITPLRGDESADNTARRELRIFMFEDFPWFQFQPAVALVIAPDEAQAQSMLAQELIRKKAPHAGVDTGSTHFTEIEVKAGIVVTLSTGMPPDVPGGDVQMS